MVKLNVNIQHCIPNDYIPNPGIELIYLWVKEKNAYDLFLVL